MPCRRHRTSPEPIAPEPPQAPTGSNITSPQPQPSPSPNLLLAAAPPHRRRRAVAGTADRVSNNCTGRWRRRPQLQPEAPATSSTPRDAIPPAAEFARTRRHRNNTHAERRPSPTKRTTSGTLTKTSVSTSPSYVDHDTIALNPPRPPP
jgi:hypothetical protein